MFEKLEEVLRGIVGDDGTVASVNRFLFRDGPLPAVLEEFREVMGTEDASFLWSDVLSIEEPRFRLGL